MDVKGKKDKVYCNLEKGIIWNQKKVSSERHILKPGTCYTVFIKDHGEGVTPIYKSLKKYKGEKCIL